VDREIGDVPVGFARIELIEAAPRDDMAVVLGHDHGMARPARLQPLPPLVGRAPLRLERGEPIVDALVVDVADGCRVRLDGRPYAVRAHEDWRAALTSVIMPRL